MSDAECEYERVLAEYESELRASYPILSRVKRWREDRLKLRQRALLAEHKYKPHFEVSSTPLFTHLTLGAVFCGVW